MFIRLTPEAIEHFGTRNILNALMLCRAYTLSEHVGEDGWFKHSGSSWASDTRHSRSAVVEAGKTLVAKGYMERRDGYRGASEWRITECGIQVVETGEHDESTCRAARHVASDDMSRRTTPTCRAARHVASPDTSPKTPSATACKPTCPAGRHVAPPDTHRVSLRETRERGADAHSPSPSGADILVALPESVLRAFWPFVAEWGRRRNGGRANSDPRRGESDRTIAEKNARRVQLLVAEFKAPAVVEALETAVRLGSGWEGWDKRDPLGGWMRTECMKAAKPTSSHRPREQHHAIAEGV